MQEHSAITRPATPVRTTRPTSRTRRGPGTQPVPVRSRPTLLDPHRSLPRAGSEGPADGSPEAPPTPAAVREGPAQGNTPPRPAEVKAQPPAAEGGGLTVLLAEDERAVRLVARRQLLARGYRVLEAASGAEALRLCEGHEGPIHLLVTDVVMPGMNGRQLAERVIAARPDVKVLFVSGYTDDEILRHGVRLGQVHFLPKPFTLRQLAETVRAVLDDAQP